MFTIPVPLNDSVWEIVRDDGICISSLKTLVREARRNEHSSREKFWRIMNSLHYYMYDKEGLQAATYFMIAFENDLLHTGQFVEPREEVKAFDVHRVRYVRVHPHIQICIYKTATRAQERTLSSKRKWYMHDNDLYEGMMYLRDSYWLEIVSLAFECWQSVPDPKPSMETLVDVACAFRTMHQSMMCAYSTCVHRQVGFMFSDRVVWRLRDGQLTWGVDAPRDPWPRCTAKDVWCMHTLRVSCDAEVMTRAYDQLSHALSVRVVANVMASSSPESALHADARQIYSRQMAELVSFYHPEAHAGYWGMARITSTHGMRRFVLAENSDTMETKYARDAPYQDDLPKTNISELNATSERAMRCMEQRLMSLADDAFPHPSHGEGSSGLFPTCDDDRSAFFTPWGDAYVRFEIQLLL